MPQATRIPHISSHAGMEAKMIASKAGELNVHDFFSYADMSALVGVNVQEHRHILDTARELARKVYGKIFDVLTNQGWVCLTEAGKLGHTERKLQKTYRQVGRINKVLVTVDPTQLTPIDKHRLLCQQSLVGSVQIMTHPKTLHQLEAGHAPPGLPWDVNSAKDLFQ